MCAAEMGGPSCPKSAWNFGGRSLCGGISRGDPIHQREGNVIFPHRGAEANTDDHFSEAARAADAGAKELDMVMNYVLLKQERYAEVFTDIAAVRNVAPHPIILKVILETSQLSPREIIAGCKIAESAGADYVKTSTGFNGQGASQENVRLMKSVVGENVKVKASGGVKTVDDCVVMMEAGAERIGTSNGVWIMQEARGRLHDGATQGESKG